MVRLKERDATNMQAVAERETVAEREGTSGSIFSLFKRLYDSTIDSACTIDSVKNQKWPLSLSE
jgi:hypothetical protein